MTIELHTADIGAKVVDMRDGSLGSCWIGQVVRNKADPIANMQSRLRHGYYLSMNALQCKKRPLQPSRSVVVHAGGNSIIVVSGTTRILVTCVAVNITSRVRISGGIVERMGWI